MPRCPEPKTLPHPLNTNPRSTNGAAAVLTAPAAAHLLIVAGARAAAPAGVRLVGDAARV
ncbi:MAG: hypothetical protein H0X65_15195 [Gemmatimonadetes bacterium]|nr:hypothetical protein [Gemmatimonadota bacterium]